MKRLLPFILVMMVLISGCTPSIVEPTYTDDQLATRVNQILTTMPTHTPAPTDVSPVEEPTATGGNTIASAEPDIVTPQDTAVVAAPTETLQATEEPQPTATLEAATQTIEAALTPDTTKTPSPTEMLPDTDPRKTLGNPTTTDDMSSSTTWNWPLGASEFSEMTFKDGKMLLKGLSDVSGWRLPIIGPTSDMYIEMKARPLSCQGTDNYGIIFNMPVFKEADRGYLYSVSCDGKYKLSKWDGKEGKDGKMEILIQWKSNDAIKTGANVDNRLGVLVKNEKISLYANGVLLESKSDDMYRDGYFGVFVNPEKAQKLTVEIDEMSFWDLD